MQSYLYPASFLPDESGRPVVSFPDFPWAHTDGRDRQEAAVEAADCLGSVIAQLMAERAEVPPPIPLWIAGKLALRQALAERGVSNSEIARRLGTRETTVRRMLNPHHATRTENLEAALTVLGKRLTLSVEDAA